uniref:Uncharacterized protein n=1 Tax=Oryza sativa subsp. japonica TaxID=39947 RepID=Q7XIK1_ORYSJ|nr:hypothetical protein [Oryza sativa Japonica Group]BAD30113.1 hypothetical protein [Oryza sativa Japonica Group]
MFSDGYSLEMLGPLTCFLLVSSSSPPKIALVHAVHRASNPSDRPVKDASHMACLSALRKQQVSVGEPCSDHHPGKK